MGIIAGRLRLAHKNRRNELPAHSCRTARAFGFRFTSPRRRGREGGGGGHPAFSAQRRATRARVYPHQRPAGGPPPPQAYHFHTSQVAGGLTFPILLGKVARSAGWGVARWLNPSRVARPPPGTCIDPDLLSAPHPAFGHLPRFAEKGNPVDDLGEYSPPQAGEEIASRFPPLRSSCEAGEGDHAKRGGGGRRLMAACDAAARARGAKRMRLRVRLALPENERLFERYGFVRRGLKAHDGFDAPTTAVMEKRIS